MADQKPDLAKGIDAAMLDNGALAGTFEGDAVVLIREQGRVRALSGECTHHGAPMEDGLVVDGQIRCPWHHARFSLETGEAIGAPAFAPLGCFEVVEEGGTVRVTGRRKRAVAKAAAPKNEPIVIVGGGAAGHACADLLARNGRGDDVVMLSADAERPYDRTECSKQYLSGEKDRGETFLESSTGGEDAGFDIRTGTTVTAIDTDAKTVTTDGGDTIAYSALVLATGAEPQRPDGFSGNDVFVLRTLADADALIAAAKDAKHALVLGASFIGLEVAAAMRARDLDVTVVATDDLPLAPILGPEVGDFVRKQHEEEGVTFHLGRTIERWAYKTATLDDGTTIAADFLVLGTGVAPRVDLARSAGLSLADEDAGGGVRVDGRLRTSADDVYAIGDIASYPDPVSGHAIRVEHWVHAQRQGQHLARLLLGHVDADYVEPPFFWSAQQGSRLNYVGHAGPDGDRTVDGSVEDGDFVITYTDPDGAKAELTCSRDERSLKTEARWSGAKA